MNPIVFFSHSSKDKLLLEEIKNVIHKNCKNEVNLFVSSDGQSMPIGKNWVHSLEKALKEAKLMFVFLTPNSINSHWVYFESGYAYSKGIDVIPVGIAGIDLNDLKPPINLLQGFNLNSYHALNNIIALMNKRLNTSIPVNISKKQFQTIESKLGYSLNTHQESIAEIVDLIYLSVNEHKDIETGITNDIKWRIETKLLETLNSILSNEVINADGNIHIHGMNIRMLFLSSSGYEIRLDPYILQRNLPILKKVLKASFEKDITKYGMELNIKKEFTIETDSLKVSSRILNSRIKAIDSIGQYLFIGDDQELKFRITGKYQLKLFFDVNLLESIPIEELIQELIAIKLLVKN